MSIMTVDIAPRQLGDPVYVSQGDIGRIINVHMYDGDDPYIPPAGVTPYIQGLKPSGLGFNVQGTITDNICTFSTTDEMTDEVGDMVAEVRLIKTGMDIGTANFRYSVEERPRPDGTTDGTIEVITDVIADALNDALEDIDTARTTAVAQVATASAVVARTVAEMTDESAVYLYTGSETGYTAGNWYYYNGSAWTSGGTYGGAVTSTTFNQHGVPADDFAVGEALAEKADSDDVTALEGSIETLDNSFDDLKEDFNTVSFSSLTWTIGKTVGSSGSAGTNLYGAMTNEILVLGGESVMRRTPIKDSNNNTLTVHVCQYKNGVFQSRTSLTSTNLVLSSDTTSVSFNFSRTSSSGVQMTAEDISTYFRDVILRKLVAEADYKPAAALNLKNVYITESQAQTEYANLAASLPLNTYSWVGRAWFNDVPTDLDSYIWIFTLSANNRTDAITQIAFAPKSNFSYSRRLQSGSFTEWKSSKDSYSSNSVYYAYGDSLTWGAVWDNDQSSVYYQAGLNDQIPTRIAHAIGSTQFTNKGVSGARFVKQGSSDTTTIIGDVIKADNLSGVNIVTIGGGRNDSATSLGSGDTATANDGTICGAVVDILEYLTTNYPKLQIVMYGVTPQPTTSAHAPSDIFTRVFAGGWSLNTYYTEMKKVCARYGVPFIDWYDCTLTLRWGVLSGGYSSGTQNWSHPLSSDIYRQMGNYIGGRVASYYTG